MSTNPEAEAFDKLYLTAIGCHREKDTLKAAAIAYAEACGYRKVNDRHRRTDSRPHDFDVEGVDFVRISKEDWERLKACREDTQFISRHLWDDAFDAINAKLEGGE